MKATQRGKRAVRYVIALISSHGMARGVLDYAQRRERPEAFFELGTLHMLQQPDRLECDGLIAPVGSQNMAGRLVGLKVPIVNISVCMRAPTFPSVWPDDEAAGRMAAEHLIEHGFRQFAFIGVREMGYAERRITGFIRAVVTAGFPYYNLLMPEATWGGDDILAALNQRIADLPKPVGIMVDTDARVQQVIEGCRSAGVRLPEEAALVSAGNNPACCAGSVPTLSSVDLNQERIGFEAAALMVRLLEGKAAPAGPVVIQPRGVCARQSTDVLASGDPAVAVASRFIRDHAHESITIRDIVEAMSISRRSLESKYRKAAGRSPHEDLQAVRLERARGLLAQTSMTLAEISLKCGYNYPALMYRAFRKAMGMTPGEYRQQVGWTKAS